MQRVIMEPTLSHQAHDAYLAVIKRESKIN